MSLKNLVNYTGTTHDYSSGDTDTTYSHDENFSTSMTFTTGDLSGTQTHTATSAHTFAKPRKIKQWKYRIRNQHYALGDGAAHSGSWKIEYKVSSGDWTLLTGSDYSYSGGEASNATYDSETQTINLEVADVTDVRAYSTATSVGAAHSQVNTDIFEIEAWGSILIPKITII